MKGIFLIFLAMLLGCSNASNVADKNSTYRSQKDIEGAPSIKEYTTADQRKFSEFDRPALDPKIFVFKAIVNEQYPKDDIHAELTREKWIESYMTLNFGCPADYTINSRIEIPKNKLNSAQGLMYILSCPNKTILELSLKTIHSIFDAKKRGDIKQQMQLYNMNHFSIGEEALFNALYAYHQNLGEMKSYEIIGWSPTVINGDRDNLSPNIKCKVVFDKKIMVESYTIENNSNKYVTSFGSNPYEPANEKVGDSTYNKSSNTDGVNAAGS